MEYAKKTDLLMDILVIALLSPALPPAILDQPVRFPALGSVAHDHNSVVNSLGGAQEGPWMGNSTCLSLDEYRGLLCYDRKEAKGKLSYN